MVLVSDLTERISNTTWPNLFLYCLKCQTAASACRSAYGGKSEDAVFKCCDENVVLARKKKHLIEIVNINKERTE